jgi:hypothetical protein
MTVSRPESSEHAPYYGRYISLVPDGDIVAGLREQGRRTKALFSGITEHQGEFRYAPGKWTINQMFGHMIDAERIFSYRALRISRGDKTPIEGFEQDEYVAGGPFEICKLTDLLDEYTAVRNATVPLFRNLGQEAWSRTGVASNNGVTVRALAYIIAGHELHHCQVLQERYLSQLREGKSVAKS